MIDQVDLLLFRSKNEKLCDWNNDLCLSCKDAKPVDPAHYIGYIRDALDRLFYNLPRALINLVLPFDVRQISKLSQGSLICELSLRELCPCAAFPTVEQVKILNAWVPQYEQGLIDLISSGLYDTRDDFTVIIQPFLAGTRIPVTKSRDIDLHYFAPDCFHVSGEFSSLLFSHCSILEIR
jgi:phospholipase B1